MIRRISPLVAALVLGASPAAGQDAASARQADFDLCSSSSGEPAAACARLAADTDAPTSWRILAEFSLLVLDIEAGVPAVVDARMERLLALPPSRAEDYVLRAEALEAAGRTGMLQEIEKALALDPINALALAARGEIMEAEGDLAAALRDYSSALAVEPDALTHYRRGLLLQDAGDHRSAVADFDAALKLETGDVESLSARGFSLWSLGDERRAMRDFDRALKIDPRAALVLARRGNLRLQRGDKAGAMADATAAIGADPDLPEAWILQADAYLAADRADEARQVFDKALARMPEDGVLHYAHAGFRYGTGDLAGAVESYTAVLKAYPDDINALVDRGLTYIDLEAPEKARTDLERAIALEDGAAARLGLARILSDAGDYPAAYAQAQRAGELSPADVGAWLHMGYITAAMGEYELTEAAYAKALALDSLTPDERLEALTGRAEALSRLERWDEAEAAWRAGAKLAPENADVQLGLGLTLALGEKPAEAFRAVDRAVALAPDNADALALRGMLHQSAGRNDAAMADFNTSIALDPDGGAVYRRGELRHAMGDVEGALADFEAAVAAHPDNPDFLLARGMMLIGSGRCDRAIRDFNRVLELTPGSGEAHMNKGLCYRVMTDHARAVEEYDKAIAADASLVWAWFGRSVSHQALGDAERAAADMAEAKRLDPSVGAEDN